VEATTAYVNLAGEHGLSPAQMALAYVNSRPFVTSNLIGATTLDQLVENIESANITLSDELLGRIESLHQRYTYPCP
jgi:aryl-alcohol dehydrogenase-like predicted oxidoreductase